MNDRDLNLDAGLCKVGVKSEEHSWRAFSAVSGDGQPSCEVTLVI